MLPLDILISDEMFEVESEAHEGKYLVLSSCSNNNQHQGTALLKDEDLPEQQSLGISLLERSNPGILDNPSLSLSPQQSKSIYKKVT